MVDVLRLLIGLIGALELEEWTPVPLWMLLAVAQCWIRLIARGT